MRVKSRVTGVPARRAGPILCPLKTPWKFKLQRSDGLKVAKDADGIKQYRQKPVGSTT